MKLPLNSVNQAEDLCSISAKCDRITVKFSMFLCSAQNTPNNSQQGASEMGKVASVLARGESLTAHARSAEYRILD